ncbi:hypothetical protein NEUTE1DRAFT_80870 [Neurospora tetrasperma FGSC 2508]|uniref:Cora-domain-containing protein n=1 Tax=Neurospora tetrasperma (strain FGSC 2508 / ATCC MYA-4615 / P0657) TaxID=510951 RepID=F8MK97_NEUT8|nr:uncharacterized protein NEUTE1DRAFT_80870 [Neurospora tetrasperma FGSC 2508]EGO57381.1 hypothetical protein NEUTE1DRAFT_80870 [Neurospora tetrasperma FGSC 2508]EGZ72364.1 hypothetical protein NEUTE2DRAFT_158375 [Neurospora tetrasperma FGSC 2509]
MGSRSPSHVDNLGVQNYAGHGRSHSHDFVAENNEAIPNVGKYHNARDFAALGPRPAPSMTLEGAVGDGEGGRLSDDRWSRPHVYYPFDNTMGTNPVRMDIRSTVSTADLPNVCRRSTVRSGIFKTVDDFQDFDVGGPGWHPGAEPGLDPRKADGGHASMPTLSVPCDITVVDFSHDRLATYRHNNETLASFISLPQPEWVKCRWISVNGLSWDVIQLLGRHKNLHRLAIEDLLNPRNRTKAECFFECSAQDVEAPIIRRLQTKDTIIRQSCDASMVGQAIIDAIIDLAMPVTTCYTEVIGDLELDVLTKPNIKHTKSLYILVTEMNKMLSFINPVITLINALRDHKTNMSQEAATRNLQNPSHGVIITPTTYIYLGDVLDHCLLITDTLTQLKGSAEGMIDLIFNTISAKQNESMKQLTIVTIIFLPLTFLTGYFGQNFEHFPGPNHSIDYFWKIAVPVVLATGLLLLAQAIHDYCRSWVQQLRIGQLKRARKRRRGKKQTALPVLSSASLGSLSHPAHDLVFLRKFSWMYYINGLSQPSSDGATFLANNPMTGQHIYMCASVSVDDYSLAITTAYEAYRSRSKTGPTAKRRSSGDCRHTRVVLTLLV